MAIIDLLDKKNLHHAYLIEGRQSEVVPEILEFAKSLGIETHGNPDFYQNSFDNFKIEDAFSLREMGSQKGFSDQKKIFIISVNNFSLDAQGVLLKLFEEPIEDTHFFIIVPDKDILLKTLVSRFYLIEARNSVRQDLAEETKVAEKFISVSLQNRILMIKDLLVDDESEEDEEGRVIIQNSARSKALKFLDDLEAVLHQKVNLVITKDSLSLDFFNQIFIAREYIRQPGSSTKSLMESVALSIPIF